jgi:hypothetical protein
MILESILLRINNVKKLYLNIIKMINMRLKLVEYC